MVAKFALALVLTSLPASSAAFVGRSHLFLGNGMQPEIVAKTLSNVEDEWRAQAAVFVECDGTKGLPGATIVNCADAPESFGKSCGTVVNAIIQGSGGDKDVAKEYMADVCSQSAISGWHQLQCHSLATSVRGAMSADKYSNRVSFNSAKLCSGFWSQFLDGEKKRIAKEEADRQAEEKKAAEEAAEQDRKREEAKKQEAERKKAEEAQSAKEEAQAKAAESAAHLAEKKAEAEAVQQAAKNKMEEAKAAEAEKVKAEAKQEEAKKAATTKPVAAKAAAPKVEAKPAAKVEAKPAAKVADKEAPAAPKPAAAKQVEAPKEPTAKVAAKAAPAKAAPAADAKKTKAF
jgi:hypothetical protein